MRAKAGSCLHIGDIIDHYEILEQIGEGGMGVVYRAHDQRLGRDVALKVLAAAIRDDLAARERLFHEARTASQLNHPHICIVHDVGETSGQIYIAMELVKGMPVKALTQREALPVKCVLRYGAQIADGLAHAHEHSVIHRDLKSSNVLITFQGNAKILDFGLAIRGRQTLASDGVSLSVKDLKSLEDLDGATNPKLVLSSGISIAGTPHYMAPELFRGQPADERSDIWSLGVVFYEMAAGRLPFQGKTGLDLSAAILCDAPAPLAEPVPPALREIIQRCLSKESEARYQRAAEVFAALHELDPKARPRSIPPPRRRRGARIRSLAVLPLQNLSGDPEQEYFADGMTEAMITELAKIQALKVISRGSAMQYKATSKPTNVISGELDVDAVVQGSVLRSGTRVRISAQLIHAASDKNVWAESFDRELSQVLMVQTEVARAIAAQIRVKLTSREKAHLGRKHHVVAEVFELYLKARFHWNKLTLEGIQRSIEYYQQALALDPAYALAYAGLADSYNALQFLGFPSKQAAPQASEAAERALELDPTLAGAHSALASTKFFYRWDWAGAEREFLRALELDPGSAGAHQDYAYVLTALGRHDQAIAHVQRAHELDPLALIINANLGWRYHFARRDDQAIQHMEETLELDPHFGNALWCLGCALAQKGQYTESMRHLRRAVEVYSGNPQPRGSLGHVYGLAGETAEARKIAEELEELSRTTYVSPWALAIVYIGLRDNDRAFAWLEKTYAEREASLVWLKVNPEFDPVRPDPRFENLLRRMNLSD